MIYRTNPIARPLFFPGGEEAVLAVHGFTGYPGKIAPLARSLNNAGYTVAVPRLPGHGTDSGDFSNSNRGDWRRRVLDSWADLAADHGTIHLVGQSMGALLVLDLASRVVPASITLLAPAIRIANPKTPLAPLIAPFRRLLPRIRTDWQPDPDDDEEILRLGEEYWRYRDVGRVAELWRLVRETRTRLSRVSRPALILEAGEDTSVPAGVGPWLAKRLPVGESRFLTIRGSDHGMAGGEKRELVARETLEWIRNTVQREEVPRR